MTNASSPSRFFGTRGNPSARIMIIGEAYGKEEDEKKQPLVGASGQLLDDLLVKAGLNPAECFYTNLVNVRPPENDFTYFLNPSVKPEDGIHIGGILRNGLNNLEEQISVIKPEVIIGLGNWPLWYLTRKAKVKTQKGHKAPTGIGNWHGSQLKTFHGIKFVPIYHPAAALRQWELTFNIYQDLRARVFLKPEWSRKEEFILCPNYSQILSFCNQPTPFHVVDLETKQQRITVVGIANGPYSSIAIPLGLDFYIKEEEKAIRLFLHRWLNKPGLRLGNQNWRYDSQWLLKELLVKPRISHDSMIMHHLLFPGTPKDLNTLSSLYCAHHEFWKEEGHEWEVGDPIEQILYYNCLDTSRTWEITKRLEQIITSQGKAGLLQERLQDWDFATDMMYRGIKVDLEARNKMIEWTIIKIQEIENQLSLLIPPDPKQKVSWWNSPKQTMALLYGDMKIPVQFDRKTKKPTINDEVFPAIKKFQPMLSPLLNLLQDLRSLQVVYRNHLTAKLRQGRFVCEVDIAGTETFRFSTRETPFGEGANLQNFSTGER